jgi:V/A-type H+-transporting ATPase subunit F
MKIAALCDIDTATGLHLAGVKEVHVPKNNTREIWLEVSERNDLGILFITEPVAEEIEKELKEFRVRKDVPIIIEIPDKKGRKKDHIDYISHLIKKAVGVEVKKGK